VFAAHVALVRQVNAEVGHIPDETVTAGVRAFLHGYTP
jgi:hypothetical protein